MLTFLRRIRRSLIDSSSFRKYLLYAIGEIALVVIGILIALQINNWNEHRKSKLEASTYILKLKNDLITDTLNIDSLIEMSVLYQKEIDTYFKLFESEKLQLKDLVDTAMAVNWRLFRYHPVNYTFEDMQFSGNLNLIDEDVRAKLIELSNFQKQFAIVQEKFISTTFTEREQYSGYLDTDHSDSDFFEIVKVENSRKNLAQGLLHRHNLFTQLHDFYGSIIWRGNYIKVKNREIIRLLDG